MTVVESGNGPLRLQVITPEGHVIDEQAEIVILPGTAGELGILRNHVPLVSQLDTGIVRFGDLDGGKRSLAISGGFVEVSGNEVTVLVETAELAEEIDVIRAKAARDRARARLNRRSEDIDYSRAENALKRALNRLRAAGVDTRADE